jgi:hypothetical protein
VSGNHSNDRRGFLTIFDNVLTVGGQLGAKSELAGLSLNQKASHKELEVVQKMAQWRTLLRRSGGSKSAANNISTLPGPTLKKPKSKHASIYNLFFY